VKKFVVSAGGLPNGEEVKKFVVGAGRGMPNQVNQLYRSTGRKSLWSVRKKWASNKRLTAATSSDNCKESKQL
jgi:hypothetical protein